MYAAQMKVRRFHEVFGCKRQDKPGHLSIDDQALRIRLIQEELDELDYAMANDDMEAIADGIGDLLYVVLGTAVAYGINIDPIFEAIHNANMAKLGGTTRPDGKILKPEGWQPPDIRSLLIAQGWKP